MVRALDLRLDGREFDSWLPQLVLGWMTIFGRANQLSISAGWKMSTSQSAVMLCGWSIKAGMAVPLVDKHVCGR